MNRKIITTNDGSTTIFLEDLNESYHSKNGAIQESKHVFIKNGLDLCTHKEVAILEIGFGTGLNAFITLLEAQERNQHINYVGVEAYPVNLEEINQLNFVSELTTATNEVLFEKMHHSKWETPITINDTFVLEKRKQLFEDISDKEKFDLIYFDAFGFPTQPDLWSEVIFKKMYEALKPNGILVTYACRTIIKKNMQAVGFKTEKLLGAPGKREMLRARRH